MMRDRAILTALTAIGSLCGHHGGDYLVQDDCMARWKQARDEDRMRARRELALHATSYAATQAATKALFYRTAGVQVPVLAQLAGAATEAVLHVIDDGRLLRRFSRLGAGRQRFLDEQGRALGRQQRFHDDVPGGRAHMDQAAQQQLQIPAGTVVTIAVGALLARRSRGRA